MEKVPAGQGRLPGRIQSLNDSELSVKPVVIPVD